VFIVTLWPPRRAPKSLTSSPP